MARKARMETGRGRVCVHEQGEGVAGGGGEVQEDVGEKASNMRRRQAAAPAPQPAVEAAPNVPHFGIDFMVKWRALGVCIYYILDCGIYF